MSEKETDNQSHKKMSRRDKIILSFLRILKAPKPKRIENTEKE